MFSKIKKLWSKLCYLFQAEKVWACPKPSKVVIYDAVNREILLEYIKPWSPEILHVRNEQINMRVLLKSLFRGGSRVDAYIDCYIDKVSPHLILTSIDNVATFYKISLRHPNVKTLSFQNGLRSYYGDVFEFLDNLDPNTFKEYFIDYMFVFGSVVGNQETVPTVVGSC